MLILKILRIRMCSLQTLLAGDRPATVVSIQLDNVWLLIVPRERREDEDEVDTLAHIEMMILVSRFQGACPIFLNESRSNQLNAICQTVREQLNNAAVYNSRQLYIYILALLTILFKSKLQKKKIKRRASERASVCVFAKLQNGIAIHRSLLLLFELHIFHLHLI